MQPNAAESKVLHVDTTLCMRRHSLYTDCSQPAYAKPSFLPADEAFLHGESHSKRIRLLKSSCDTPSLVVSLTLLKLQWRAFIHPRGACWLPLESCGVSVVSKLDRRTLGMFPAAALLASSVTLT
jgi:hypothetical protein